MEKLLEKRERMYGLAMEVKQWNKAFEGAMAAQVGAVYSSGALPAYVKRLMALTGALAHGCEGCIMSQTLKALDEGATAEQVMEACLVAISLGGTMAMAESTKVLQLLKEKGLM